MPKRTYQPTKRHRLKKHGFMTRQASVGGKKTLKRRRAKGRVKIASTNEKK